MSFAVVVLGTLGTVMTGALMFTVLPAVALPSVVDATPVALIAV